jgi:type I restriction enzyme S subunit
VVSETETYFDGQYDPNFLVEQGDLVVGMDGDFNCTLWRGQTALLNQRVCKLSPHEQFYRKKLLAYALPGYLKAINAETSSVTVKHLSSNTIAQIPLPLPPLPEQDRIVAEMEKQFTRLDAAVAALKRVQANLKRYRASVLTAACEGRLVPTEAELARGERRSYEPASALLARILADQPARPAPDHVQEPSFHGLPQGWTSCRSADMFSYITSGSRGWAKHYSEDGPLFIRIGNLNPDSIALDLREPQYVRPPKGSEGTRTKIAPGDILISITAELGSIALVPEGIGEAYVNQHIALARPTKHVLPAYLAYFFASEGGGRRQLERMRRGATKAGLGLDDIRAVEIPLPPLMEQSRIVAEIDRRISVLNEMAMQLEANLKRAERLRQSILKRAFEGKLLSQDPNDEPTSILLERIRGAATDSGTAIPGCAPPLKNKSRRKLAHRKSPLQVLSS